MEILDTASSPENKIAFSDAEVAVVKAALKTKLFKRDETVEIRSAKFAYMVKQLAVVFGLPEINTVVSPNEDMCFCGYRHDERTVYINRRFSLTSTLTAFGAALAMHKPELIPREENGQVIDTGYHPLAFALSMFKQAAPNMFEEAKRAGRLAGTSVPYTDGGRLTEAARVAGDGDSSGDDDSTDAPDVDQENRPQRPPQSSSPDIDPENRTDRGNGLGED